MGKIAFRRPLLLRFNWARPAIAATLGAYLTCVLLLAVAVHALDPNKHITQYMHTSWRIQDGSLPAGMYDITQTSDGFLWFLSLPGEIYRFDGVRFVPWRLPAGVPFKRMENVFADHSGGLWLWGRHDIVHLKDGVITSQFKLGGDKFQAHQRGSGRLFVGSAKVRPAPLPCDGPRGQMFRKI